MEEITGQEALNHLNRLRKEGVIPDYEYCIVEGKVGSWRTLPDGQTVFYCPPVYKESPNVQP